MIILYQILVNMSYCPSVRSRFQDIGKSKFQCKSQRQPQLINLWDSLSLSGRDRPILPTWVVNLNVGFTCTQSHSQSLHSS